MSRPLTTLGIQELFASQSNEVLLFLVRIGHDDWVNDVRLVNNPSPILSNSETFDSFPVDVILASQDSDNPQPTSQIEVGCVDIQLLNLLRGITSPAQIYISAIIGSAPDDLLLNELEYELMAASYDKYVITGNLTLEPILTEPYPGFSFDNESFPGLWRG